MTKAEVQRKASARLQWIESIYRQHVPENVHSYYRLLFLIQAGRFQTYYRAFGLLEIDLDEAVSGKLELDLGALTDFERNCGLEVNIDIQKTERRDEHGYRRGREFAEGFQPHG
jgi:hypothetical protein